MRSVLHQHGPLPQVAAQAPDVHLSWNDPDDSTITHYKVLRRQPGVDPAGQFETVTSNTGSNAASYTGTTAESGTTYVYRIKAYNANGGSRKSAKVRVTTAPSQVRNTHANQPDSDTAVTVSWSTVSGAERYQVERKPALTPIGNAVRNTVSEPATSYEDNDTQYNTQYLYRVRAENNAGYGPWSDTVRHTTHRQPGTPARQANVSETEEKAGSVIITWQAPTGDEDIDGYRLYRRNISSGAEQQLASLGSDTTSYTDDNVAVETWYTYWMVAHNSVDDSPKSNLESIKTKTQTPDVPQAPDRPTLSEDTPGEVVISWTAPAGDEPVDGYRVYRKILGEDALQEIAAVAAPTGSHTDDTVAEETWYEYHVRAYNEGGNGDASRSRYINTLVQTPGVPRRPTRLDASEDTAGAVTLSWTAPATGPTSTGYKIYRERVTSGGNRDETLLATTSTTDAAYTDDTVAAEIMYQYRVRGVNDSGTGSASSWEYITTGPQNQGQPDAPEDVSTTE